MNKSGKKFSLNIRLKLLLFLCGISFLTLGLVWLLTTRFLQPQYNRYIEKRLQTQLTTLVSMMNASEEDIATRDQWVVTLNETFWAQMNEAITSGKLDIGNCCVDVSDSSYMKINYVEGLRPCLIHEDSGGQFGHMGENGRDSSEAMRLRRELFSEGTLDEVLQTPSGARQLVVGALARDGEYGVMVSTSLARIDEAGAVLGRMMPWIALVLLLLCFLLSLLFSQWFTRPLTELSQAARRLADGDYSVRVQCASQDEVGLLAEDFNHMAGEVERASELQRDLLANVSHDLRTPLTLIKGYAETVRDISGDDPAQRTDQLNVIVDETDRLSGLVNSVMELSKVSSGTEQPEPVSFDMSQLCEEVAERYEAVCAQNGYTLQLQADEPCPVYADPGMMERVLHNLLGNAMHHIGPDGVFVLRALPQAEGATLVEVEDYGEGIAEEDLPYIFDRYYRSRSDAGKVGTGLGLSITKAILQSHGFRFGVRSAKDVGTTFWFILSGKAPE